MEKIGEVLVGETSDLTAIIKTCQWLALWNQVVDERVGKKTTPLKIENRVLYVTAANATWAQQLNFLRPEFVKKFNQLAGTEVIADIRFKTTGGE